MEMRTEYRTRFTLGTGLTGAPVRQPELTGGHAGRRSKDTPQMALVGEPGIRGDIGERIPTRQRIHCVAYPEPPHILAHCHAVAAPEGASQMNWMCSDALGNGSQAERPAEFGVQDFYDVLQPTRSARLSLCRMPPGKLIEQLDGRGFQQQSGPLVRVGEGLVRPPR